MPARWATRLVLCCVVPAALAVTGWLHFLNAPRDVVVSGTVEAREIPLAAKAGGRIARVLVREGDIVSAGQALLELDLSELEARRNQLASQLKKAEARLQELRNGPRQEEIVQAEALAGERYFEWKMLEKGSRPEEIGMAAAEQKKAESELEELEGGYRKEEIDQARALVDQCRARLEWAKRDFDRYRSLAADGAVSGRDADDAETKLSEAKSAFEAAEDNYKKLLSGPRPEAIKAARAALRRSRENLAMVLRGKRLEEVEMARHRYLQAQAALALLKKGTRPEEVAQAAADVSAASAAVAEVEALLKDRFLVSPAEAEVTTMDLHPGQVIAPNKPIAKLIRLDDVWTRIYIPEKELARVKVGDTVRVKVDAYPAREFRGKVVQIPSAAEFTPRNVQTPEERANQVFAVKVEIDNGERLLRGGMNAEVRLPGRPCLEKASGGNHG
ncbi:MAG TPA: efflux RND transporter periplasmic adaptor subunit [Candidatus Obscuribacterales bacterium]